MTKSARLIACGRKPYREILELQRELHARVAAGQERDSWLVVEHDPVVTLGRNARAEHLSLPRSAYGERGVDVYDVERGGDVTYHGPGQLVVYPIVRLERFREVVPFVRSMEAAAIETCAAFDVRAERWSAHSGVWVEDRQICAVGLAVRKMATLHGLALNVSTDLGYDRLIVPCGLPERGITSLVRETGRDIALSEAQAVFTTALERAFDIRFEPSDLESEMRGMWLEFGTAGLI